jgi:hypothetical protein
VTLLKALAHLRAAHSGYAEPLSEIRHRHLTDQPLVIVPLNLAGEAAAPLAAMVGTDQRNPSLLVVPQPRNRDLRFAFFTNLAHIVLPYIAAHQVETETLPATKDRQERRRYVDAPQVLVPNSAALAYLGLLGRSTRFRRTEGPYAVGESIPILGRWLTFLAERAEHPGSSLLLAVTDLLTDQWATGQSPTEDANLAALLGWIDPPSNMTGLQAALAAENPLLHPPAGPATDPGFDKAILQPAIEDYDRVHQADDPAVRERAIAAVSDALATQLEPTWELMWRAIALLHGLPEAPSATTRWAADRNEFTTYSTYLAEGGRPQPRRDYAVTAASRLDRLERAQAAYDAQRALEDPFVLAERRTTGEAFAGTVVATEAMRVVPSNKGRPTLRPRFALRTDDPVRIEPGKPLVSPARLKDRAQICEITADDASRLVVLEVTQGMGTPKKPRPEAVPKIGDEVCYTVDPGYWVQRQFPTLEETPWTHGGSPHESTVGDDEDTEE